MIRIIVIWGLDKGPLILGNYHIMEIRMMGSVRFWERKTASAAANYRKVVRITDCHDDSGGNGRLRLAMRMHV